MQLSTGEITQLLAMGDSPKAKFAELFPVVFDELRKIAAKYMRQEKSGHTLEATALVNEAYMRLVDQKVEHWENRNHFFGVAAQIMRRILVDHARARYAEKRGGDFARVTLTESIKSGSMDSQDLILLDDALVDLANVDPRAARVVEMRFFGGMSLEETAEVLQISVPTVKRDWTFARAWLYRELAEADKSNF